MKKIFTRKNLIIIILLVLISISCYRHITLKIREHILLPPFSYIDLKEYDLDYITVEGTITQDESSESKVGGVLNTNKFTCDKKTATCTLVQANLSENGYLSTYTEAFLIQSWDDNFIVFTTDPEANQCVIWTYRIDRVKKELIGVREKRYDTNNDACSIIGNDKFIIKVVDGFKVISKIRGYKN